MELSLDVRCRDIGAVARKVTADWTYGRTRSATAIFELCLDLCRPSMVAQSWSCRMDSYLNFNAAVAKVLFQSRTSNRQ